MRGQRAWSFRCHSKRSQRRKLPRRLSRPGLYCIRSRRRWPQQKLMFQRPNCRKRAQRWTSRKASSQKWSPKRLRSLQHQPQPHHLLLAYLERDQQVTEAGRSQDIPSKHQGLFRKVPRGQRQYYIPQSQTKLKITTIWKWFQKRLSQRLLQLRKLVAWTHIELFYLRLQEASKADLDSTHKQTNQFTTSTFPSLTSPSSPLAQPNLAPKS